MNTKYILIVKHLKCNAALIKNKVTQPLRALIAYIQEHLDSDLIGM